MRQLNIRVDDEFYAQAKAKADELGISLSDLVREAVKRMYSESYTDASYSTSTRKAEGIAIPQWVEEELKHKREQVNLLTMELSESHRTADDASKRSDTIIAQMTQQISQMTQQLDRAQLQLEDLRTQNNQSFWQKLFGGK